LLLRVKPLTSINKILNANERVVLADRRCGLVQKVFSGVGDTGVNLLDTGFFLLAISRKYPACLSGRRIIPASGKGYRVVRCSRPAALPEAEKAHRLRLFAKI